MGRTFSFRQKLGGAFALLLSLIILHGIVAWLALQEYNNLFGDLRVVNQIVETTLRAHLNEKNYVLREDRHSAIIVQEELQQAQTLVNGILQNNSPLGKSLLQDMSISLTNYMNTFSQYVIYEDQHQALDSEEKRLAVILLEDINHLQEMSGIFTSKDINRINWLLTINKNNLQARDNRHSSFVESEQELASLITILRQNQGTIDKKLLLHRITSNADNYLQVLKKMTVLHKLQQDNESKMAAAAEEVQALGKTAAMNQQVQAKQGQLRMTNVMIIMFFLSIGVALWGTFYLTNRLTRPLKDLALVTSSLGQGNFNERIAIEGDDEFHTLLISINQMAENISSLNSNMEQLVEERTKALEIETIRFQKLFENNPEGILIFDKDQGVLAANDAFTTIFGYTLADILHRKVQDFLLLDNDLSTPLATPREETFRRCKDGTITPVSVIKYSFQQLNGQTLYYAIYTDISERKKVEEQLHFLSFHDSLTTLKNRTYFELEMEVLQKSQETCGIIVCDVDGLKVVNDTWGHAAGDQLLKDASQVLIDVAGTDSLARVGGDEFVIFLPGASEKETLTMAIAISNLLDSRKSDYRYPLMLSIGYAHRQNGSIDMEDLFSIADKRMYAIKKSRRENAPSHL